MKKIEIEGRAQEFTIKIILFCKKLPRTQELQIISNQLIRSASSVGANIVEGRGSSSRREFINFMNIARKSAFETTYWLEILSKLSLPKLLLEEVDLLLTETDEIRRILGSIIIKSKKNL